MSTALVLTWATAVAVFLCGLRLARVERLEPVPIDAEPVRQFADDLGAELDRLQVLYFRHLADLAAIAPGRNDSEVRTEAVTIAGVRQCSVLTRSAGNSPIRREIAVPPLRAEPLPHPELTEPGQGPNFPNPAAIPVERAFEDTAGREVPQGWITPRNSRHGVFWRRVGSDTVVAIVVDRQVITDAVNTHLAEWVDAPYAPLRAGNGIHCVVGPADTVLAGTAPQERPADSVLRTQNRLGTWQIASWTGSRTRIEYSNIVVTSAGILAATIGLLGTLLLLRYRRAVRLAEQRVSFVNRVSHELGAPLTNVMLNLELASEALETRPAEAKERLATVTEEARRLGRLVSNVLAFSRHERGRLVLRPARCVPDEVLNQVLEQFAPALERSGIAVTRVEGARSEAYLDADALAQIVGNLVSNVEKYAAGGRALDVATRIENGRLRVRVADRGPGIPAADRERIFLPFERGRDLVADGVTGTGLGLAIARQLAERMGGTLRLAPSETGAMFELDVAASAPEQEKEAAAP